jgi:hypothetical protein
VSNECIFLHFLGIKVNRESLALLACDALYLNRLFDRYGYHNLAL